MINLIRDFVRFLSQDGLTADDVVMRVGDVAHDPGIPMPMRLRTNLAGVHSALLARYRDTGLPYLLILEPEPGEAVTVAEMKSVFGDYRRSLSDRGQPVELVFSTPQEGKHWHVTLIAELAPGAVPEAIDKSSISSVALRRDPTTSVQN